MRSHITLLLLILLFVLTSLMVFSCCDCSDNDDEPNSGLDPELRAIDFMHLVHLVNKYYGPINWKEELFGENLLDIAAEYRDSILRTKNDQDFLEIMFEYVSLLHDSHSNFAINSNYTASLDFSVDLYDGKLIVDTINDPNLPLQIGDELISMDGESAQSLIDRFKKYMAGGFDLCSRRWATTLVTYRFQEWCPEAVSGDVVIELKSLDGSNRTEIFTWRTSGTPYSSGNYDNPFAQEGFTTDMDLLERLQLCCLPPKRLSYLTNYGKYGQIKPIFDLPDGFQQRYGSATDQFFTGTYTRDGKMIGFLRLCTMYLPGNTIHDKLQTEILDLKEITDGLVIDVMNNPGGLTQFVNFVGSLLHTEPFPQILFEFRATLDLIQEIEQRLGGNIPDDERDYLEYVLSELYDAYEGNKTLTEPISLDPHATGLMFDPITDTEGNPIGYDKPIIILINEYSTSAADAFPAMLQDTGRAKLIGNRTNGAGGTITGNDEPIPYSESGISLTRSLMVRSKTAHPEGYPETRYIENVGVHPDYFYDYQNMADLLNNGQKFVDYFTTIILQEINS